MIVFGNKVSGEDAVKGLMFVKEPLWNNNGLLFDMADNPKDHSMWTKNTYIPLDIIFLCFFSFNFFSISKYLSSNEIKS